MSFSFHLWRQLIYHSLALCHLAGKGQVDDQRNIKSELFEMLFILFFLTLTEFLFALLEKYVPCNKMGKGKSDIFMWLVCPVEQCCSCLRLNNFKKLGAGGKDHLPFLVLVSHIFPVVFSNTYFKTLLCRNFSCCVHKWSVNRFQFPLICPLFKIIWLFPPISCSVLLAVCYLHCAFGHWLHGMFLLLDRNSSQLTKPVFFKELYKYITVHICSGFSYVW